MPRRPSSARAPPALLPLCPTTSASPCPATAASPPRAPAALLSPCPATTASPATRPAGPPLPVPRHRRSSSPRAPPPLRHAGGGCVDLAPGVPDAGALHQAGLLWMLDGLIRSAEGRHDELGVGAAKVLAKVLPDGTEVSIDPLAIHPFFAMFSAMQSQVVLISMAILFMLFSVQRFGADKVGYTFVPVISVWFLLIAGIEMYNRVVHDIGVLRAFSPMYIVQYFIRNGKSAWVSLGEIILCVTGFFSFNDIVFPLVALCYIGQVVYLRKFPHNVANTFYRSIPAPMFWPAFIVAILAGIIASQAMLSRAFAILSKALSQLHAKGSSDPHLAQDPGLENYRVYGFRYEHNNLYKVDLDYPCEDILAMMN
ncbi:putative high-affinity potassium transporter [Hordeum vulgare]|nr:putative high-affinity potassium transporter [Hordeum vulgare]